MRESRAAFVSVSGGNSGTAVTSSSLQEGREEDGRAPAYSLVKRTSEIGRM